MRNHLVKLLLEATQIRREMREDIQYDSCFLPHFQAVRDHLMKLLLEAVKRGTCEHLEVSYTELNHQLVHAGAIETEVQQQMAVLQVGGWEKGERWGPEVSALRLFHRVLLMALRRGKCR